MIQVSALTSFSLHVSISDAQYDQFTPPSSLAVKAYFFCLRSPGGSHVRRR